MSTLRGRTALPLSFQDRQANGERKKVTRRIFTDRKQTIMKKSHEISTIIGRPGVEVEVLIKDGNEWYMFHSTGWIPGDRPGANAHIIENKGPGDFMTHNEALQAGISGSSSQEQSRSRSRDRSGSSHGSISESTTGSCDMLDILASRAVEEMARVTSRERESSPQETLFVTPVAAPSPEVSEARSSYSRALPIDVSRTGTPVICHKNTDHLPAVVDLPSTFLSKTTHIPHTPDSSIELNQIQTPPPTGSISLIGSNGITQQSTSILRHTDRRSSPIQREASMTPNYFDFDAVETAPSHQSLFEAQLSDPSYNNNLHWSSNGKKFIMGGGVPEIKKEADVLVKPEIDTWSEKAASLLDSIPEFVSAPPALGPLRSTSRQRKRTSTVDLGEVVELKRRRT
ncbi:hypothetical protein F5882DRAFT_461554 [Hyaloscypha sp. PMI_1271]|nr:hypothetical protein F5882DRAFT_461554 [Hyaloscypha sp. PMI_1271]